MTSAPNPNSGGNQGSGNGGKDTKAPTSPASQPDPVVKNTPNPNSGGNQGSENGANSTNAPASPASQPKPAKTNPPNLNSGNNPEAHANVDSDVGTGKDSNQSSDRGENEFIPISNRKNIIEIQLESDPNKSPMEQINKKTKELMNKDKREEQLIKHKEESKDQKFLITETLINSYNFPEETKKKYTNTVHIQ
ncbi:MAG: hypothetical protein U9532_02305 ['Conium maculatum' witches'-broom phytoplasma]|nr:hypothetical protein ['Conium maculatum' witches'-broom phytoplasma]